MMYEKFANSDIHLYGKICKNCSSMFNASSSYGASWPLLVHCFDFAARSLYGQNGRSQKAAVFPANKL